MSSVVADAVEHLVRGIVDNPDDVRVDMVTSRRGRTVEVHQQVIRLGYGAAASGELGQAVDVLPAHLLDYDADN